MRGASGARHLLEGGQRLDDGDQTEQGGGRHHHQNDGPRLVLLDVPIADLFGGQTRHPSEDQAEKQHDSAIPAHQHAAQHRPVLRKKEKDRASGGHGDPQPRMLGEELLHYLLSFTTSHFTSSTSASGPPADSTFTRYLPFTMMVGVRS